MPHEDNKPVIALFTPLYENVYSGVATYARLLVAGLGSAGIPCVVISPDCMDEPPHRLRIVNSRMDVTPNRWLSNSLAYVGAMRRLDRTIRVLHFLDAREISLLKKPAGVTVIGTVHDTYSFDLQSAATLRPYFIDWKKRLVYYYLLHKIEKRAYRKADHLISNTEYVRSRLCDFYDVEKEKITTIHIGAPIGRQNIGEKKDGSPFIISFTGGNFQRKGLVPLAEAVRLLRSRGLDIRIHVAGRDEKQRAIEAVLAKKGCGGFVDFKGYIAPAMIPSFLSGSDLFAMPSVVEAYGLVYLEAMACGVPVIGTMNGGAREIIHHGVNGLLCNPASIEDIAEKITRLFVPETREKIIKKGYETLQHFTNETSIHETIRIYKRFLP